MGSVITLTYRALEKSCSRDLKCEKTEIKKEVDEKYTGSESIRAICDDGIETPRESLLGRQGLLQLRCSITMVRMRTRVEQRPILVRCVEP